MLSLVGDSQFMFQQCYSSFAPGVVSDLRQYFQNENVFFAVVTPQEELEAVLKSTLTSPLVSLICDFYWSLIFIVFWIHFKVYNLFYENRTCAISARYWQLFLRLQSSRLNGREIKQTIDWSWMCSELNSASNGMTLRLWNSIQSHAQPATLESEKKIVIGMT